MANWTRGYGDRQDPRHRPGRPAHGRDRRRDQLQVPEHPAVADPVGRRLSGSRSRSRRTTGGRQAGSTGPQRSRRRSTRGRRSPRRGSRPAARDGVAELDERCRGLEGRRLRDGADAEPARRPRVVDRRRQPRQLHRHLLEVRLGAARERDGGRRRLAEERRSQVPDGLGGWHVIQLLQNGAIKAQVPYFVKRSLVGKSVSSLTLKAGQPFTIHLKGVGWTQLDNTIAVDYDNSYIGLRLRLQLERRRRDEHGRNGWPGHAPDRHVPAAVHAAAVVREHAVRHGAGPDLRARRPRPRTRATSCLRCGWRSPSSNRVVPKVREGCFGGPPSLFSRRQPPVPAAEHGHQRRDEDHPDHRRVEQDRQGEA